MKLLDKLKAFNQRLIDKERERVRIEREIFTRRSVVVFEIARIVFGVLNDKVLNDIREQIREW